MLVTLLPALEGGGFLCKYTYAYSAFGALPWKEKVLRA
jgi:hypothetical protein